MWKNGSQCDPLPNVRRDFPIYIARLEGREDIDWLLDDIAKDSIRREGFASRISKNARSVRMLDPKAQGARGGGGVGTTRSPVPQIAKKMNLRKTPMDMNIGQL